MSGSTRREPDCPFCSNGIMRVADSRQSPEFDVMRRRRRVCDACGKVVTTHEIIINEDEVGAKARDLATVMFLEDLVAAVNERFGVDTIRQLRNRAAVRQARNAAND